MIGYSTATWLRISNQNRWNVVSLATPGDHLGDRLYLAWRPSGNICSLSGRIVSSFDADHSIPTIEVSISRIGRVLPLVDHPVEVGGRITPPDATDTEVRLGTGVAIFVKHRVGRGQITNHGVDTDDIMRPHCW